MDIIPMTIFVVIAEIFLLKSIAAIEKSYDSSYRAITQAPGQPTDHQASLSVNGFGMIMPPLRGRSDYLAPNKKAFALCSLLTQLRLDFGLDLSLGGAGGGGSCDRDIR